MVFLIQLLIILALFSFQTTLLDTFSFAGVAPDLALIFVVHCGIHYQRNGGIAMGFIVGMIQDCLSGRLLGVNTLSKTLIGFFFSALKNKIIVEGVLPTSIFLLGASLVDGWIFYFVLSALMKAEVTGGFLFHTLPIFAGYNAFAGLVLFYFLDRERRWVIQKFPGQRLLGNEFFSIQNGNLRNR